MNKAAQKKIEVYAHWVGLRLPTIMGFLSVTPLRGKEIFSFEYHDAWLKNPYAFVLDPALQFFSGAHYVPKGQEIFGVFSDSSPDRWGRMLMKRREAQVAREEGRKPRTLLESDYLLGVCDAHRMGALRFKTESTGPFLDNNKLYAAPPWASLRNLEQVSLALEQEGVEQSPDYSIWLQMLVAPGRSLGGARPKASITDPEKHLWIAKFPSGSDEVDIGAWEMVAYRLAQHAQITLSDAQIKKFKSSHHTFLSKRFDRTNTGERLHFVSAMTMLGYSDGAE